MKKKLYVHSVRINATKLKKVAELIGISRYIPVHTFATIKYQWRTEPTSHKGIYWYCAGDFRTIPQPGLLSQKITYYHSAVSTCLVAPNIKKVDPSHHNVIGGDYGIHYVCHNITNRVLYPTGIDNIEINGSNNIKHKAITIAALHSINITGYKIIVLSHLGVYGVNYNEWRSKIKNCLDIDPPPNKYFLFQCVKDEILKLHFRACTNTDFDYKEVTSRLSSIDYSFSMGSRKLFIDFSMGDISIYTYNDKLYKIIIQLLKDTEKEVGLDLSLKIHGISSATVEEGEMALREKLNSIVRRMKNIIRHIENKDADYGTSSFTRE